jgi:hypothetical protein
MSMSMKRVAASEAACETAMAGELTMAETLAKQSLAIQGVMAAVMTKGKHYGTIPGGGDKPTLLKAGAEKLALAFHLAPEFEGERKPVDLGNGHREYIITCRLYSLQTGQVVASGLGSCSTLESRVKSRFSSDPAAPGKGGNLPDAYNVIMKQAKKRALVDAVLTATAASDLFTQDLEDLPPSPDAVAKSVGTTRYATPAPLPVPPPDKAAKSNP